MQDWGAPPVNIAGVMSQTGCAAEVTATCHVDTSTPSMYFISRMLGVNVCLHSRVRVQQLQVRVAMGVAFVAAMIAWDPSSHCASHCSTSCA